jgi:hypothetical protein
VEAGYTLLDAHRKERLDNSQGLENFECAWFNYRRAIPLQRGWMCIDDTALDPTTMELRSQEKPGRACTHHKNTHISNHVELLVEKTGVTSEALRRRIRRNFFRDFGREIPLH